jgi:hypothetical protein
VSPARSADSVESPGRDAEPSRGSGQIFSQKRVRVRLEEKRELASGVWWKAQAIEADRPLWVRRGLPAEGVFVVEAQTRSTRSPRPPAPRLELGQEVWVHVGRNGGLVWSAGGVGRRDDLRFQGTAKPA